MLGAEEAIQEVYTYLEVSFCVGCIYSTGSANLNVIQESFPLLNRAHFIITMISGILIQQRENGLVWKQKEKVVHRPEVATE